MTRRHQNRRDTAKWQSGRLKLMSQLTSGASVCSAVIFPHCKKNMVILPSSHYLFHFFSGKFAIVEPFPPENGYPAEFTSTQITCVAYDSSGIKVPESIQFVRKDNFALYTNLTANENIYFTNKTEGRHVLSIGIESVQNVLTGVGRSSNPALYIVHELFERWVTLVLSDALRVCIRILICTVRLIRVQIFQTLEGTP